MFPSHIRSRFYVTKWLATRFYGGLSAYSRPLPSEKIAPIAFRKFLIYQLCAFFSKGFSLSRDENNFATVERRNQGNQLLQKNYKYKVSGLCGAPFFSWLPKGFTRYRALFGDAMLVYTTSTATRDQQKHQVFKMLLFACKQISIPINTFATS